MPDQQNLNKSDKPHSKANFLHGLQRECRRSSEKKTMESALEAKLEGDKEIIQAVTKQEMRRALLRNKISALRNTRSPLTAESQAYTEDGTPIRGQRSMQHFFVTEKQVTHNVMKRLKFPEDELRRLEREQAEEEAKASMLAAGFDDQKATELAKEKLALDGQEEEEEPCVFVGEDEEETVATPESVIIPLANLENKRLVPTAKAKPVVEQAKPAEPVKLDEIDRILAQINKDERRKQEKAQSKRKNFSRKGKVK